MVHNNVFLFSSYTVIYSLLLVCLVLQSQCKRGIDVYKVYSVIMIQHYYFTVFTYASLGLFQKKSKQGELRIWNFQGYLNSMGDFQRLIKNKVEFTRLTKKRSCGISRGLCFWPWNFQGISHNFVEYPGVELCF